MGLSRVEILRSAVTKVVEVLAEKRVKVVQRGMEAKVTYNPDGTPREVYIPYLPDNASEELCDAVQGFVDHEIGHVLDTDPKALRAATAAGVGKLHNIIEDVFVESRQEKRFRGSAYNLDRTRDFFLKTSVIPSFSDPAGRKSSLINCACRAWGGQLVMQKFMEDKWGLLEGVAERVPEEFKARMRNIKDSWEALELAKELKTILTEPPSDDKGDGEGEGGGDGKDESKKDKSKKKEKDKSKKKEKGKPEGDEDDKKDDDKKDDGEGDDKKDDKKDDDKPSDDKKDDEGDTDDTDDKEDDDTDTDDADDSDADDRDGEGDGVGTSMSSDDSDAKGDGKTRKGDGEGGESDGEGASPFMSPDELDDLTDFDEAMADSIKDASLDAMKHAEYHIFSREWDMVKPAEQMSDYRRPSRDMTVELEDKVSSLINTMQKGLERAMASRSRSVWENGRRSGSISGASLHRLSVNDDRVFRKKIDAVKMETAVTLLVDASGSMHGGRMACATEAAFALALTLERLSIPYEVIAFTTKGDFPATSGFNAADRELRAKVGGGGYGRSELIYMPIIKSFTDRLSNEKKDNFAWMGRGIALSQNPDGECLQYAAERLLTRRERRKVMLVLSDGEPCCPGNYHAQRHHLQKVVIDLNKRGVEAVGIGIQTESVRHYYPKHVVLHKTDDLPGEVMRQLQAILV